MAKASQYKRCLGVKLSVFSALSQISKINSWLNMISPGANPSFVTYYYVFAKTSIGGYTILNQNDFAVNSHGELKFIGTPITFKEFSLRVEKFLNKPLENVLTHDDIKDIPNFFKNLHLPYNKNIGMYQTQLPKKKNDKIYTRLKIMALCLAYGQLSKTNNKKELDYIYHELGKTYKMHQDDFTEIEKKIVTKTYSQQDLLHYSWYAEGLYALCYVCDLVSTILFPTSQCSINLYGIIIQVQPDNLKLNKEKAVDMVNLYYSLLWTKRDANLNGKSVQIDEEIVTERYRALVWLFEDDDICYDEVTCDT